MLHIVYYISKYYQHNYDNCTSLQRSWNFKVYSYFLLSQYSNEKNQYDKYNPLSIDCARVHQLYFHCIYIRFQYNMCTWNSKHTSSQPLQVTRTAYEVPWFSTNQQGTSLLFPSLSPVETTKTQLNREGEHTLPLFQTKEAARCWRRLSLVGSRFRTTHVETNAKNSLALTFPSRPRFANRSRR